MSSPAGRRYHSKEPKTTRPRLIGVLRPLVVISAVAVAVSGAGAAAAQTEVELRAAAGIGGYVDPTRPVAAEVTVSTPVLLDGFIEVVQSGSTVVVPVEVPAGGSKTYTVIIPPPVTGRTARVRLYQEGADRALVTETLQIRSAENLVLVGLASAPGVRALLTDLRTEVGGVVIEPVELETTERDLRPLAYLVVGDADLIGPDVVRWIDSGGRAVGVRGSAERLGTGLRPLGSGPDGAGSWYAVGDGEFVEYATLEAVEDWERLLRPVPVALEAREVWQTPDRALANAATNGGQARIPSLPWLWAAIIGYTALVGPINLVVLGRLRRRELAWVTVPVLSLVAVGAFWLAGRSRLETEIFSHASVLVAGPGEPSRTAVAMAAGKAGSRLLGFPSEWMVYPSQLGDFADAFGNPVARVPGEVGDDGIRFDLPQLGIAAVQAIHGRHTLPGATVGLTEGRATITVDNPTELAFWAWGVVAPGRTEVAPEALDAGEVGVLEFDLDGNVRQFGPNIGDAVVQARQLWEDERGWQVLYPLGEAAGYMGESELFFFGYTDDYTVPLAVDGRARAVNGSTLVIVPISTDGETAAGLGRVAARLVSVGDAGWIERGPGSFFVSTDELLVSVRLPRSVDVDPTLAFNDIVGERPERFEVWDWIDHAFVPVSLGDRLPRGRFVAADGEVFVRARASDGPGGEGFAEIPMAPTSVELRWESA